MFLVRLAYASTAVDLNDESIKQILESANQHNPNKHLTGVLCFSRKYFLQCLEGPRANVSTLYAKICQDKRHSNVLLLDYQEISRRVFSDWSMAYIPERKITKTICLQYSTNSEFNPYQFSQKIQSNY